MANPPAYPAQVIASFAHQTSNIIVPKKVPAWAEPLPPDVEAARKDRVNNEMVALFRQPCPAKRTASIQGIGLYTHASGIMLVNGTTTRRPLRPEFLPIGGPNKILPGKSELAAPLSEELQQSWKQMEATVNEEENLIGEADLNEEQLRERYGAMNAPDKIQKQWQEWMEAVHKMQVSRISGGVATGGTDNEGGVSNRTTPVTHAPPRANVYYESRDPRKR
jgi:hypothetical protein